MNQSIPKHVCFLHGRWAQQLTADFLTLIKHHQRSHRLWAKAKHKWIHKEKCTSWSWFKDMQMFGVERLNKCFTIFAFRHSCLQATLLEQVHCCCTLQSFVPQMNAWIWLASFENTLSWLSLRLFGSVWDVSQRYQKQTQWNCWRLWNGALYKCKRN